MGVVNILTPLMLDLGLVTHFGSLNMDQNGSVSIQSLDLKKVVQVFPVSPEDLLWTGPGEHAADCHNPSSVGLRMWHVEYSYPT